MYNFCLAFNFLLVSKLLRSSKKVATKILVIVVVLSNVQQALADETDENVLKLIVEMATFVDVCGDQYPVAKEGFDTAFSRWSVLRLPIPKLAEALRRDSTQRQVHEAAVTQYLRRIPSYEREIECSGRYEILLLAKPTLAGDSVQVPKDVLIRYGPPSDKPVPVTQKPRTVPIPPQRPPYFISLGAERSQRCEVTVVMGDNYFSRPGATYGPMTEVLAPTISLKWKCLQGEEKTKVLDLTKGVPPAFQAIRIRVDAVTDPVVIFEFKEKGRESRIPYGESSTAATKRQSSEALWRAANFGKLEEVKALLDRGADIDFVMGEYGPSVMRVAFNASKFEVVDYLLSRGAKMRKSEWRDPLLSERAIAAGQQPDQ